MIKPLSPTNDDFKAPKVLTFFLWGILCIIVNFLILSYVGSNEETVIVKIKPGSNTVSIAQTLEQKGVIQNGLFFRILARGNKLDNKLKAGYYNFSPHLTIKEVINRLAEGETFSYSVTIPEGYSLEQIASLMDRKGLVDKQSFLHEGRKNDFPFPFLAEAQKRGQGVEGYLFPSTYQIEPGSDARTIITMMLKQFNQVITPKMQGEIKKQGLSLHKVVTLASITEREAKAEKERSLIAAVFRNRIEKKMKLQSCATVQYVLKTHKDNLSYQDIRVNSPYNTYLHLGLPPGPIANPGKASLEAAIHPAHVDYLFFVAKGDGTHYFSQSFQQHLEAIRKAEKMKKVTK